MTLSWKKAATGYAGYWNYPIADLKMEIDMIKAIDGDCYNWLAVPNIVATLKTGTDYLKEGIDYAHSIGLKFHVRIAEYNYTPEGTLYSWGSTFWKDALSQQKFLTDFEWLLQHDIDGIEIEESEGNSSYQTDTTISQKWRNFKNGFLATEKASVMKYKDLSKFVWGFNWGNSWLASQYTVGYDIETIKAQKLVNFINIQCTQPLFSQWQNRYKEAIDKFVGSGIDLSFYHSINTKQFNTVCTGTHREPACYNQSLLDELKVINPSPSASTIFTLRRLKAGRDMWPNDTTPTTESGICYTGESCIANSVKYLWKDVSSPSDIPIPVPLPIEKKYLVVGGTLVIKEGTLILQEVIE